MNSLKLDDLLYEIDSDDLDFLTEEQLNALTSGTLTEEEINELFTRKKTLVKKIKELDPQADEDELNALSRSALKKMLKQKREDAGEDTRGFFAKTADRIKGIKDIGMFGNKAGTLLGGNETFDIKKRKELKDNAKKEAESWLKAIEYKPLTDLYNELVQAEFPNKAKKSGFKTEANKFQKIYDDVVSAHEAEQLDTKTANTIIAVLRGVVIYFQDFAMNDQYYYRESKEESLADLLFEEVEGQEEEKEEKLGRAEGDVAANFEAAYGMKLPLGLLATGAACMALGFAADSLFVQDLLGGMKDMKKIQKGGGVLKSTITKAVPVGGIEPGEGIIKATRRMVPGAEKFGLPGGPSIGEVYGGGKNATVLKIIKASMNNAQGPAGIDKAISMNADPARLFTSSGADGMFSGTSKGIDIFGLDPGQFHTNVTETIEESLPTEEMLVEDDTTRNKILNGLMKWAGPALKGLGLGFLAAGAASGFMRWKGKGGEKGSGAVRGSRMSILKVMVDGFKDIGKEGTDDPPPPPPGDEEEIVIDLFAQKMSIKLVDKETGEEEEVDLDLSGYVPNLPALVEMGITAPNDILSLLSEAHTGEFNFKDRKGNAKSYPEDEGTFGASFKNFDDYPTLLSWVNALLKVQHKEFGPITKDMLDGSIKDGSFTLNDKRKGDQTGPGRPPGGDPPGGPPKTPPGGKGKPRLGLVRLDDDGLKLYRASGRIGDKKYDNIKGDFEKAEKNALIGNDTSPTVRDIETQVRRQKRTPDAKGMTYDQMVGRKGLRGPDLKKDVELDPHFVIDKSAHSDIWKKKKPKSHPRLGKGQQARTEKMLKLVLKKFTDGDKKLTRGQANKVVRDYFGRGRGGANFDKETRDKVVDILVNYGLVKEEIEPTDVISESVNHVKPQADERWMTLAGLGEDK